MKGPRFPWGKVSLKQALLFVLFGAVLYFPVFMHLDVQPVNAWDESLFAIRAIYMEETGSYMPDFGVYRGLPHHRNTKLPFTTFLQVLSFKVLGVNELALRLPVGLLFIGLVFYLCRFFYREWGAAYVGVVFGLLMVASTGFVKPHLLRTGDHDAPFAIYLTLSLVFFHRFLQRDQGRDLLFFSLSFIAALLTKNLLAGLIAPALLLHTLMERRLLSLLRDYRVYLALLAIIGAYAGTVGYLEFRYPGFWQRMWDYELMGRYSETIERHEGARDFYLKQMFSEDMWPFMYGLPLLIPLLWDERMKPSVRALLRLCLLSILVYGLVISFSETKTYWYHAPLIPFSALALALGIYHLYDSYLRSRGWRYRGAWLLLLLGIYAIPYTQVIEKVYMPKPIHPEEHYGILIKFLSYFRPHLRTFTLTDDFFATTTYFYLKKYNGLDQGYDITYARGLKFQPDQVVATCQELRLKAIRARYETEIVAEWEGCTVLRIVRRLPPPSKAPPP